MKNTFGNSITVTLFGESHGEEMGAVLDGIAPGIPVNQDSIRRALSQRRPSGACATSRTETDDFRIVSGVFEGKTTGAPLCILIPNEDKRSAAYAENARKARPGHADYTAQCKYHGFQDYRGGGHFSGRVTAPLVAVGAILADALASRGILIGTHASRIGTVCDRPFHDLKNDISALKDVVFPVLDGDAAEEMQACILAAKADGDSVGGILETAVIGIPAGVGEPWFDSVESVLSHILFSIPAVKGVSFGSGFDLAEMRGSEANDPYVKCGGVVMTATNHNGGIGGGITNGMPLLFKTAIKPTPSIAKTQRTVSLDSGEETEIAVTGRHDPCIVHRARAVVDACTAIALADLLALRCGTDFFCPDCKA